MSGRAFAYRLDANGQSRYFGGATTYDVDALARIASDAAERFVRETAEILREETKPGPPVTLKIELS